jgi:hypothetical protein
MPELLERMVADLIAKGMDRSQAFAIATKQLQRAGNLKPGTHELTLKGKTRQDLGAAWRARNRASKKSGKPGSEYQYNAKTNRATLKRPPPPKER